MISRLIYSCIGDVNGRSVSMRGFSIGRELFWVHVSWMIMMIVTSDMMLQRNEWPDYRVNRPQITVAV